MNELLIVVAGIFFLMTLYTYYENRELKQSAENVRLRVEKLFDGQTNIKAQDNEEYTSPYKELFDANMFVDTLEYFFTEVDK